MTREEILQIARKAGSLIEAAQEKDLLWLERYTKMAIAHVDGNDTSTGRVDKVGEKRHKPLTDEDTVALIKECRDAFAEELSAWDIEPPLHHVQKGHDNCVKWLSAHGIQEQS